MIKKKSFLVAFCLLLAGIISTFTAHADEPVKTAEAVYPTPQISIRLETEPRLQAPLRTLVSSSPQTYVIEFPEPMERESVSHAIQKQGVAFDNLFAPELAWDFRWENDRTLHAHVSVTKLHTQFSSYLQGEYQVNVNGSLTSRGTAIADAPIFAASIQEPLQLWRYSLNGEARELFARMDEPYSLRKLDHDERYMFGIRPTQYCECDADLEKLYALYDLQEKQLIRYPVKLQTSYVGKGDFVADLRGFFYEQPEEGIQVPYSSTSLTIHVEDYVYGASLSKDGKYVFMAVGKETQEKDLSILLYSIDTNSIQVLDEFVYGSVPSDEGFGRRMPVQFLDDGERVSFVLHERDPFRELRYQYVWSDGRIKELKLPISDESWFGFTTSSDNLYRHYANGGLYRGAVRVTSEIKLPFWSEHWVKGTHQVVYVSGAIDRSEQKQYTGQINLLDVDLLEEKTLYTGLYNQSDIIGGSEEGEWIYVAAREPVHMTTQRPLFGSGDGKLLAPVKQNVNLPITVYMDDTKLKLEHAPLIVDDYALFIPLREVLEAGGWKITWETERQTLIGMKSNRSDRNFQFNIDSDKAKFNGTESELPLALKLVNDTTYLYAGVLQKLGMRLDWDDSKRVLFIRQIPEEGGIVLLDGSKYEGELKGEVPSGRGRLFDKVGRLIYEGEFMEGKFHGQGKLYSEAGRLVRSGVFEYGKILK